jgi:hypothetical protein
MFSFPFLPLSRSLLVSFLLYILNSSGNPIPTQTKKKIIKEIHNQVTRYRDNTFFTLEKMKQSVQLSFN